MLEQAIKELTEEVQRLRTVIEAQVSVQMGRLPSPKSSPIKVTVVPAVPTSLPNLYMNEHEVADMANLSVATVRRWRLFQTGPPYRKIGSAVRYSRQEVVTWLEGHLVVPADRRNSTSRR